MYVCVFVYIYLHAYVCIYVHVYMCMCICVCVCMCMYMCMYAYVYLYVYRLRLAGVNVRRFPQCPLLGLEPKRCQSAVKSAGACDTTGEEVVCVDQEVGCHECTVAASTNDHFLGIAYRQGVAAVVHGSLGRRHQLLHEGIVGLMYVICPFEICLCFFVTSMRS